MIDFLPAQSIIIDLFQYELESREDAIDPQSYLALMVLLESFLGPWRPAACATMVSVLLKTSLLGSICDIPL